MKRKRPMGRFPRRPRKLDKNYREKSDAELQKLLTKEKATKNPDQSVQCSTIRKNSIPLYHEMEGCQCQ